MATDWISFPCPGAPQARWRYGDDGTIEVEGQGITKRAWPTAVNQWHDPIAFYASKYNVLPHYSAAILAFESGGNANAGSPAGAQGLMQLMPATARVVAKSIGRPYSDADIRDPDTNIELGTKYLSDQLKRYNGDFVSAAVAYNAGKVICGGCKSGTFWNVCTDGSAYPLIALQFANTALANGFPLGAPPVVSQPPIPTVQPLSNFGVVLAMAAGSFAAFKLTHQFLNGSSGRRRRSGFARV